ncbi:hypothetical protein ACS0TY_006911 [Phlomoides rotata]
MLLRHKEDPLILYVIAREQKIEGKKWVQVSSQAISKDKEALPEESKPPSQVDTAPVPPGGARDPNAFTGANLAQDMEESTDNAPPAVVTDQLEAFRKDIKAMHKQIHDQEFIYHDRQSPRGLKRKDPDKKQDGKGKTPLVYTEDREQPPQKRGMIQMIMGGPTDWDSFRQIKLNVIKLKAEQEVGH